MDWKAAIDKFEERRLAIWENMPHDVYDRAMAWSPATPTCMGSM